MPANITSTEIEAAIALLDSIQGTFVHRQGTVSEIDLIVLAAGELAFTTDTNELRRGDGATPGGVFICGGWNHYAYILLSTASTSYVDLISVPLTNNRTYEYKAFVMNETSSYTIQANLIISPYSGTNGPIVDSSNVPNVGPVTWVEKRMIFAYSGVGDKSVRLYGWNVLRNLAWGTNLNETAEFNSVTGDTYCGVEYSGVFNLTEDENSNLILRAKTPNGAVGSTAVISSLSIRRIK